jgi:hypothetical protein
MLHMLLWLYIHVSSVCLNCFIYFKPMLQVFYLDVAKVDLVLHMLQWRRRPVDNGLPQPPTATARALSWVTMRAPKASRHILGGRRASACGEGDWDPRGFPHVDAQWRGFSSISTTA